jgi:hypothetical protein
MIVEVVRGRSTRRSRSSGGSDGIPRNSATATSCNSALTESRILAVLPCRETNERDALSTGPIRQVASQVESNRRTHPFHDRRFPPARCGRELLLRAVILPQIAEMFHVTPQQRRSRRSNGESTIISIVYFAIRGRNRVTNC